MPGDIVKSHYFLEFLDLNKPELIEENELHAFDDDDRFAVWHAWHTLKAWPDFNGKGFRSEVFRNGWDGMGLKERMRHITRTLHSFLPADYRESLAILMPALFR